MKLFIITAALTLMLTGCSEAFPEDCAKEGYSGVILVNGDSEMHGDCSNGETSKLFGSESYITKHGSREKADHAYHTNEEHEMLLKQHPNTQH